MGDAELKDAIARLWRDVFGTRAPLLLTPKAVGGNNRVFIIDDGVNHAVAKCYLTDPQRDRLDAEWRFLSYAAAHGIDVVPRPLGRDPASNIALHSLCPGARPTQVDRAAVAAAAAFFRRLNDAKHRQQADLPPAAEACFNLSSLIALIDARIGRLAAIPEPLCDGEARALIDAITRYWSSLRRILPDRAAALGVVADERLPTEQGCISPSDFGFHNALIDAQGRITFIDFEYAGWDDPAKMVCDFFLHPALPVPAEFRDEFVRDALAGWPEAERLAARISLMQPLFALKWCCIMLNPLLPDLTHRAVFADPTQDKSDLRRRRIAAATAAFETLSRDTPNGLC